VQLFAARARAARPGFELTAEALPVAAEIARRLDGLPLAIELAAARTNMLGLTELSSLVERRLALLRDPSPTDPIGTALQGLVEWSYEFLHTDEKALLHQLAVHRGGASLSSLLAVADHDGLDPTTVNHLLAALVDKSIISVSFPDEEARYDLLDTVRNYSLERLAESGGLAAARKAHAEYFATVAEAARPELRGPEWLTWVRRLELDRYNLWAALTYARDTPDPAVAIRLGAPLGWYFSLADRVSEGRRFLQIALDTTTDDAPPGLRIELLAWLCFLATEELDYDAAVEAGKRALALDASSPAPSESALLRVTLAIAHTHSDDFERAAAFADEARAGYNEARDDWGVALSSLVRAGVATRTGDVCIVAAMAAQGRRHSEAIGYDAFLPAAMLFEAWVAERRNDRKAAADAYRRALDISDRAGLRDHAAFALAGLGSVALTDGDVSGAEQLERRALAAAEAARAPWVAAHARVQLGRALAAAGDIDAAEKLYHNVVRWSETERSHEPRETQFIALSGSPAAAALLGLAELAAARGHTEVADELRTRAELGAA
jgi:tetratricopeptide (TPR) repeat protein